MKQKLRALQLLFKQKLPGQVNLIEKLWLNYYLQKDNVNIFDLQRMLHTLVGTGGAYGAMQVSAIAREMLETISFEVSGPKQSTLFQTVCSNLPSKINKHTANELLARLKLATEQWEPSEVPYVPYIDSASHKKEKVGNLIYFVEDDISFAKNLTLKLENADYEVKHFLTLDDFEKTTRFQLPDIVIVDMVFREGDATGADVISRLKRDIRSFPPVIFLSVRNDMEARLAALRAGADRYFTKSLETKQLIQTLNGLTEKVDLEPFKVLIVDDSETMLLYFQAILQDAGINVKTQIDPLKCLAMLAEFKPDLLVLDVFMPGCSGIELAQVIRQDDNWALTPILFLTSESSIELENHAIISGGDQFLTKPVNPEYFISVVFSRARRARWVYRLNNDLKMVVRDSQFLLSTMNEHDIVSETDLSGRITSVNDRFCEVSGYSANELIGQTHRLIKSGYHPDSFYENLWDTIFRGKVWHGTICNVKKNGDAYWVESTIVPFLDENGKPYKYVSARTDVTEHRKSEERLQRSQTFANIGTWDWNIKTGALYWSDRIWSLFGYDKKITETSYDNFLLAIHPDDRKKVIDAVNDCIERGVKYSLEHRVIWADGTSHWLHESGDVIRDKEGKAVNMLGVVRDITSRKIAEEKLSETEQRFTFAVEGAGDGVWDWNIESDEIKFSEIYMEMLGYKINELPHHLNTWLSLVHPDDINPIQLKLNDYLEGTSQQFSEELRLRCKDNQYKWILCRGNITSWDSFGKPSRMVGIHTDINQRKLQEQELVEAKKIADKANLSKSQFLSNMSHELRTPMNAIIGFSQLLKTDPVDILSENQADNVTEILKAGKHLLELINEVLDLARIEAGQINISMEGVVVSDVILDVLQLVSPLADKRGIQIGFKWQGIEKLKADLLSQNDTIQADRMRLKQVLLNLLSNAIKYNVENGKITISFALVDDKYACISITDTGPGLSDEQQDHLFKPFNRLGAEESVEGSGIGLVITKNIVELMGGTIGVKSTSGNGCCFWVKLLIQQALPVQNKLINHHLDATSFAKPLNQNTKTILYIEDNPANLRLVSQLFSRLTDINLVSASEPLLGLELAMAHKPDLILLDINLPGMDGFEVLKRLRQKDITQAIPVIAISANAMKSDIEKGAAAGFKQYITKPIDINVLLQSVGNVLGKEFNQNDEK